MIGVCSFTWIDSLMMRCIIHFVLSHISIAEHVVI